MNIQWSRYVEYMLVMLAAWLVAGFLVAVNSSQDLDVTLVEEVDNQDAQPVIDSDTLAKVELFGKTPVIVVETAQQKAPDVVKVSKLHVKLVGTVVAGNKSAAMVIINGSKQQQVFFIGEMMQPAVLLREVRAADIVVDNHGKSELISLEAGKSILSGTSYQPPPTVRPRSLVPSAQRSINKQHLRKQMRNFSTLMSQARVTPHFTNKKADGFKINNIVKGSLYEEIGLQNGDVIQKVNGEAVTGAEQAMRMYRELQNATFIDVEINRGGTVQQVSYTIQ